MLGPNDYWVDNGPFLCCRSICPAFKVSNLSLTVASDLELNSSQGWLELRLAVAAWGEEAQPAWWDSTFSTSGQQFLAGVFVRSKARGAWQCALDIARRAHDEAIVGSGESFHLFRLPDDLEAPLHQLLLQGHRRSWPTPEAPSSEAPSSFAVANLELLAQGQKEPRSLDTSALGPQKIGDTDWLRSPYAVAQMAAIYARCARTNARIFPYVSSSTAPGGIF